MIGPEFKKHAQILTDMKKDLDYIFKKVRTIKNKLSAQYPEAFAEALRSSLAEECQEEEFVQENKEVDETWANLFYKFKLWKQYLWLLPL